MSHMILSHLQAHDAVTTLGECEWCGIIEHHRVAGMCPTCLNKSSGLESLPATYTHATPRSHA